MDDMIRRRRQLQHILDGHVTILPGAAWLAGHLERYPDGVLPDSKLEVNVNGGQFIFFVPQEVKPGEIAEAMSAF